MSAEGVTTTHGDTARDSSFGENGKVGANQTAQKRLSQKPNTLRKLFIYIPRL